MLVFVVQGWGLARQWWSTKHNIHDSSSPTYWTPQLFGWEGIRLQTFTTWHLVRETTTLYTFFK